MESVPSNLSTPKMPPMTLSCADAYGNLDMGFASELRNDGCVTSMKGKMGEYLVRRLLESKDFIVYTTKTNASHCFDILAVKDKRQCFFIECKTKSKREYYDDTGIDSRHYMQYKHITKATG